VKLDHLFALTDDTAVLQHAKFAVPAKKEGYTVDDNARALVFAAKASDLWPSEELKELQRKLVSFLLFMQAEDGRFHNLMDFSHEPIDKPSLGDHLGRAIWAAGCVVNSKLPNGLKAPAKQIFDRALPWARQSDSCRTKAYTCLGIAERLQAEPQDPNLKTNLNEMADFLVTNYRANSSSEWLWFEHILSYDNARLSDALLSSYRAIGKPEHLKIAEESLHFLDQVTTVNGYHAPIGNRGWYKRDHPRALYDQQPIDAGAIAEAACHAYPISKSFQSIIAKAFGWFFGENLKALKVYDEDSGACYDGITEEGLNENQGSESTVSFLLAAAEFLRSFTE